jgi:hypothetical protein
MVLNSLCTVELGENSIFKMPVQVYQFFLLPH